MRLLRNEYVFQIGPVSVTRWQHGDAATRLRLTSQAAKVAAKSGRPVRLVDERSGETIYVAGVRS